MTQPHQRFKQNELQEIPVPVKQTIIIIPDFAGIGLKAGFDANYI